MSVLLGILFCSSPLLCVGLGYYLGRYGAPFVIQRRPRRDRRAALAEALDEQPEPATVYHFPER